MIALLLCKRSNSVGGLKKCFACGLHLPISEFYKHPKMADGRLGKCKVCQRDAVNKNREKNLERFRSYDQERSKLPHRKISNFEISTKWRKADPRRMRCHNAVARALRAGRLHKEPCERCGELKVHAHHDNYDEPLNIMWLCQPCHKVRHKELDALNKK